MPKLLVKHPEKGELTFTVSGDRITVGRRSENKIQINYGTVSGTHAEFVAINGHYVLRDLESTNHCFVNGEAVAERALVDTCRVTFGTVECEYRPDDAKSTGPVGNGDLDTLRKNLGILRHQNDELVAKIADQQKQIEILGTAKLLMRPSNGAETDTLKTQVRELTAERERLKGENEQMRMQIHVLRSALEASAKSSTPGLKDTVPIKIAPDPAHPAPALAVTPDGSVTAAAPVARAINVDPNAEVLSHFTETVAKMRPLTALLTRDAADTEARREMLVLASNMAAKAGALGRHPAGRVAASLEALLRDATQREGAMEPTTLRTICQAVDLLAGILTPAALEKAASLPLPSVIAVDDDVDFLPALVASLELAGIPTTGCSDATNGLTLLAESRFDLAILDIGLPDVNGLDLCTGLRGLTNHTKTPVIVLTGSDTIESRAQSSLHGSSDFVGKPCNMFELTLKAFTWIYRHQLGL